MGRIQLAIIKSYMGFRLPPKCMTLNNLRERFKVIDSVNAANLAKYSSVMTLTTPESLLAFGKPSNNKRTVWIVLYSGFARFALLLHASCYFRAYLTKGSGTEDKSIAEKSGNYHRPVAKNTG